MPRATDTGKATFRELVDHLPGVTVRPMFANLGAFVNGWMFAALVGDTVGVKLRDEATRASVRSLPGTVPFGPGPKPLADYVGFSVAAPADTLAEWIATAYLETRDLPPKAGAGAT